jgi:glycosyltransferase involved in cell wall biosynthesis
VIENFCENGIFSVVDVLKERPAGPVPIVTYAGTFGRVNNVSYIIDLAKACQALAFPIEFHLYGSGAEEKLLVEKAKALGILDSYIKFFPPVSKENLPSVVAASTVMISTVLPIRELEDNSANKFFDSLAGARPIVINHGGWQKKYIIDNNCGYVLPKELSGGQAVVDFFEFLTDEVVLWECSSRARACAIRDFDSGALSRQIVDILYRAVG